MTRYAALLRGINIGPHKRLAMADLRALVQGAGFAAPRTLLNSGNVVFEGRRRPAPTIARCIEDAIGAHAGWTCHVVVVTSDVIDAVVAQNALAPQATNPSRLQVAFVQDAARLAPLRPLTQEAWTPEALHVGDHAAYVWCPDGVLHSRALEAAGRLLGDRTTLRNWATVLKLQALLQA